MTCTQESWPRELGRRLRRWHVHGAVLTSSPTESDTTETRGEP